MIPSSRPKLSDLYTLSQSKLLENHTLHSGTYLYSPYVAVPPVPLFPHQYIVYSNTNLLLSTNSGLSLRFQVAGCLLLVAGEVASSHGVPPPQEVVEVQLLPFSKRRYRPQKAIFINSTAIIQLL